MLTLTTASAARSRRLVHKSKLTVADYSRSDSGTGFGETSVPAVLVVAMDEGRFMLWLRNHPFGSHVSGWLVLAVVVVTTVVVRFGSRRVIFWLLARKRDSGKEQREYWRIHGGE